MPNANADILNPNLNLAIPKWINADYFENILKKDEPEYVKILKFTPTAAIPPGENFTSVMLRIHFDLQMKDGTVKQKSYVLKTMLDDDKGGSAINDIGLFPKELEMYEKYLPSFEALYKAAGKNIQLAPKCLYTEQQNGRINFVFEDLKPKRFVNVDRLKGFDMAHMRRVLEKLAQFHAASAVFAEQNGPYPEYFNYSFVNIEKPDFIRPSFQMREKAFKTAIPLWGIDDGDKYIEKFPTFEQYWKCVLSTFETERNVFNVLTHGDFWSSNVMQNYHENGAIDELLLVDYQICKWGSPAEDLLFLISISAANDIRFKEFEHFVEIYYEHLIESLKLLKYNKPLPKLRELQMEMFSQNNSFFAFFAATNHLMVVLLPTDKDCNLATLMRDDPIGDEFRVGTLTNPLFVEVMKDLFPFYHRRGVFNFQDYD